MAYDRVRLRKAKKSNYANAHKVNLSALERRRQEPGNSTIEACKQEEALTYFVIIEPRRVAVEAAAVIEASRTKLSRKEARAAAAKAAKQKRRRERRIAEANAAEATELLASKETEARDSKRNGNIEGEVGQQGERPLKVGSRDSMSDVKDLNEAVGEDRGGMNSGAGLTFVGLAFRPKV
ncbi:uncharacterized protein EAE98_010548 [Botrytis deweyae]|uniref:MADS-box domain-containing protein n=1 Tax=Botrytis deweyae TaxID=2478750 RepID=A0ABQ7I8I7_9HELO|nr:uncharacterized protein EAE98_010548 [Botrytis deweyae]KAF7916826.1 hypothetical protein EAE98_010548 [Botrytis deweyae]